MWNPSSAAEWAEFWRQMVEQRLGESNQMLLRRDNGVHNICIQNGWQYW